MLDYAVLRAKNLEEKLGFVSIFEPGAPGGLFSERPGRDLRVFGLAGVGHDRGLALVYSAAIGGWCYIVAWGALRAFDVGDARQLGGVIGVVGAIVVLIEFVRIDGRPDRHAPLAERPATPDIAKTNRTVTRTVVAPQLCEHGCMRTIVVVDDHRPSEPPRARCSRPRDSSWSAKRRTG